MVRRPSSSSRRAQRREATSRSSGEDGIGAPVNLRRNGDVQELDREKGISGRRKWRGMEACAARALARCSAAGDEEDELGLLDSRFPAAIPWARMERTMRPTYWRSSICSRLLQSPAMRASTASSVSAVVGKRREREGAGEM